MFGPVALMSKFLVVDGGVGVRFAPPKIPNAAPVSATAPEGSGLLALGAPTTRSAPVPPLTSPIATEAPSRLSVFPNILAAGAPAGVARSTTFVVACGFARLLPPATNSAAPPLDRGEGDGPVKFGPWLAGAPTKRSRPLPPSTLPTTIALPNASPAASPRTTTFDVFGVARSTVPPASPSLPKKM